jgi:hypothetical protein
MDNIRTITSLFLIPFLAGFIDSHERLFAGSHFQKGMGKNAGKQA